MFSPQRLEPEHDSVFCVQRAQHDMRHAEALYRYMVHATTIHGMVCKVYHSRTPPRAASLGDTARKGTPAPPQHARSGAPRNLKPSRVSVRDLALNSWLMPCRRRGLGARSKDQVRPEAPPRPLRQREVSRPLLIKCRWPSLLRECATKPVRRHGGGKGANRPKEALANCNWHD